MRGDRTLKVGLALAAVTAGLALPASAAAATITVNSIGDAGDPNPNDGTCEDGGGDCTLRAALQTSEGTMNPGHDQIGFALGFGFTEVFLVSDLPTITQALTIAAPAASSLTIDGNQFVERVIEAGPGSDVEISGLTITGGDAQPAPNVPASAAGVRNDGTMVLDHVTVTGNQSASTGTTASTFGGGISKTGSMIVRDSIVSDNVAGGFANVVNPSVTVRGAGIYNNNAGLAGGEVLLVERSTVSDNNLSNTAAPGAGVGTAIAQGAGIANDGVASMVLDRVTVSGNDASSVVTNLAPGASRAEGGGVFDGAVGSNPLEVRSSTITGNSVGALGVGPPAPVAAAANLAPSATSIVRNTIVSAPGSADNCNSPVGTSEGFNLESNGPVSSNTCGFDAPSDQVSVLATGLDPALGDNGGATPTHALMPGSPAIDQGDADAGETTDQRGQPRPSQFTIADAPGGDGSDIGAYEVRAPLPQFTSIDPGPSGQDDTPTIQGTVPDDGANPSDADVTLFTDPSCLLQTGIDSGEGQFAAPGITVDPVVHEATTTFHAQGTNAYGTSVCSSGPFPGTISYAHATPVVVPPPGGGTTPPTVTPPPATKKCKKGKKLKRVKGKLKCVKKKRQR